VGGADELTLPESAALSRLDRNGPCTAAALAKAERISPQSIGATIAGLQARGLVARAPDPTDGRRIVISVTGPGRAMLSERRGARDQQLAAAMAAAFSPEEIASLDTLVPLIERLAQFL
jgi:DNA-binding MarR family transcriptional regulator